jgi:H+/Cl- antiporter ClcA
VARLGQKAQSIGTGAAFGSLIGQALHTTTAERKVLLACGSAAGLAAVFGTPIAAIIFVIELLLFEFRTRSFIPLGIASVIATEVHITLFGSNPVFSLGQIRFGSPFDLVLYLLLGVICGVVATLITQALYRVEDWFHHLKLNTFLWPALGGLFVGVVGYVVPRLTYPGIDVFGPGYTLIRGILTGQYALGFLIVLMLSKAAVWLFALGSGTSGGVLAPTFMIGAALGGSFGIIAAALFPGLSAAPIAFALAGMVAVFGSATRATFAAIIFAFEMTHNYEAILPTMFACVIADVVAAHLMETSLLTEQLRRGGVLFHHELEADTLSMVSVGEVMSKDAALVSPTMKVQEVIAQINAHDPELTRHQALLIADEQHHLIGIITRGDLLRAMRSEQPDLTVAEAGAMTDMIVAYPRDTVRSALTRMIQHDIGRLPILKDENSRIIIGYLSRGNVMSVNLRKLRDETEADAGWVRRRFSKLMSFKLPLVSSHQPHGFLKYPAPVLLHRVSTTCPP